MANEIQIVAGLSASKGGANIATGTKTKLLTMAGDDMYQATQNVGTAHEALLLPAEIGTLGALMIYNMDTTNYLELAVGADMTNKIAKIRPGAFCLLEPPSATLRVAANTAAVNILVAAVEA